MFRGNQSFGLLGLAVLAALAVAFAFGDPRGDVTRGPDGQPFATSRAPAGSPNFSVQPVARPIPDGYRVLIPRLDIDLPIFEGDIDRDTKRMETPEHAAFHLPYTAIPGDGSNTYIYAHARRGMFLNLWQARVGDEVRIVKPDGTVMRYRIDRVEPRVAWNDVSWFQPTTRETLTLQTSTGPNPQDPRFVVVAYPQL